VKNFAFSDPVCERAREYASLRLDGELSELEEALLAAHLSRCEPCKSFDADIRMLTSELREAAFERPSEPIVIPGRRHAARQVLRVGTAAAVVAVALFAGAVETVLKPRTATSATPAANMLIAPGSEVRELRALNRVRLETGIRISPTLLRALRLPGDS
jgi:hypothetical protein